MASRVADRLTTARRRTFVGRAAELALLKSALGAAELPFQVLYVFGPGGIGKTSLLREYLRLAQEANLPAYYVDARNLEATPDSVLRAFGLAAGVADPAGLFDAFARDPRPRVLLLDTYETLESLDAWFRDSFLTRLDDKTLVVIAGRHPLDAAWRADPGWQALIRTISLRNLSPDESRDYLKRRALPEEQFDRILDFTHGHALALSLVADTYAQREDTGAFDPGSAPDVVKALLERFVQKVPGPAHRAALEACALVRVTTESLLAQMLAQPSADPSEPAPIVHELFEWLRALSFVESSREGLFPHDLARETLAADLKWRNPDWYRELHGRAREYYTSRIPRLHGLEQQRLLLDFVFLHRDNPVIRSMLEWQGGASIAPDAMRAQDRPALLAMVEKHEGAESARLAAGWLDGQPEGVTVYRDDQGRAVGFIAMIELNHATPEQIAADPAAGLALDYLRTHAPLRAGEIATHYRFWMAEDTYQDVSPVQTMIILATVRYQLLTHGLAYHFLPTANPDMWAPAFTYANLARLTEADFVIGGKRYGVYGHDWRQEPPLTWLAMLAEKEVGGPAASEPKAPAPHVLVLSETEFAHAVGDALRDFVRPDALRGNPLLRSRLVLEMAGAGGERDRVAALLSLIRRAADALQASPRDQKLYRALVATYLQPEPTQERAAEALDLPFSTYRRHLKAGVMRVVDFLWQNEVGGQD